jgi:hypothetical protein
MRSTVKKKILFALGINIWENGTIFFMFKHMGEYLEKAKENVQLLTPSY